MHLKCFSAAIASVRVWDQLLGCMLANLASLCWGVRVAVLLKEKDARLVVRQVPTNSSAVLCSCGKADVLDKIALSPIIVWLFLASAAVLQPVSLQQLTCCGYPGGLGDLCGCALGRSAGGGIRGTGRKFSGSSGLSRKENAICHYWSQRLEPQRLLMRLQSRRSYSDVTEYLRMGIPLL